MRVTAALVALGVLATVGVVVFAIGLWRSVDLASSSTASLAYLFIPVYAFGATLAIWFLVAFFIRRARRKRRFADPSY
jgi:uncharacterized membrane protein YiaA